MIFLRKPEPGEIAAFLESQRARDFTHDRAGASATDVPDGYVVDHTRARLGHGPEDFESARAALRQWAQFDLGWLRACPAEKPIREGEVVAILARAVGLWWLNACRIVYVIDEDDRRFGFAYGTLPGHVESGEERFLVERDDDGHVWYDVLAFSRPRHVLAKIGYPLVRRLQKRFGRDSAEAMQRAVTDR